MKTVRLMAIAAVVLPAVLLAGCAGTPAPAQPAAAAVQPAAEAAATEAAPAKAAAEDASRYERDGFVTTLEDGRLWVFRAGSKELAEFEQKGEPVKQVIRPSAGPGGVTLKAVDSETLDEYMATAPGFVVRMEDGRLWVFRAGSQELAEFEQKGEPVKQVIRPSAGPFGLTIKAVDAETLDAYLSAYQGM